MRSESNNANIVHERVGDTSYGQPERLSSSERIQRALETLRVGRISLLDFLIKIFDPNEPEHALYRDRMYTLPKGANSGKLAKLLDVIYEDKRGRQQLSHWMEPYAINLVTKKVYSEMDAVKIAMRGTIDSITPGFLRDWNFISSMDDIANRLCPTLYRILQSASQTESVKEKNTIKSGRIVCAVVIAQLAKQRSNHSLLFAAPFTLFAWVNGASRQTIEALYQCGLAISFTSLLKLLNNLATRCIEDATHAALDAHIFCYDNINISTSIHVEQRALAPAKVQSGTFPILYATRNGNPEHTMRLSPMLHRAQQASDLDFATDIRLTLDQIQMLHHQFRVHVVKILFRNSVFKDYQHKSDPVFQHRPRRKLPSGWKTKQYPLRTSTIDESSVTGNIAVINDVYMNQLKMTHEQLSDRAIPCINDQSTNARICGAKALRTQDVNPFTRLSCFQLAPGLFHLSMNLIWAFLHVHRGSIHQLGSLSYFFAVLDRTRLGGEHPDYHALLTTLMHILEGIVLNAWKAECEHLTLPSFLLTGPCPLQLIEVADRILQNHATPLFEPEKPDTANQNLRILTRDLLYVVELIHAISDGDFGRVEDMLGHLCMIFRGAGSNNYCSEILHLIFNLKRVWTEEFANIVQDNMLVNLTGLEGHFMATDLNIEHHIRFLKRFFATKGVYAGWDRLGDISVAVDLLLQVRRKVGEDIAVGYHGITHITPDNSTSINKIAYKVKELALHQYQLDRLGDEYNQIRPAVDTLAAGEKKLQSSTLSTFHKKVWGMMVGEAFEAEKDEMPKENFAFSDSEDD